MGRTYGTVRYVRRGEDDRVGWWGVDCEPHVRVWLRRMYPEIRMVSNHLVVTATVDHTADLAWALERFPMVIDAGARERWDRLAAEHAARRAAVEEIHHDTRYTPPLFAEMAVPPREYQRVAADQALRLRRMLLADAIGLGKSCSALAMISDHRARPALVVTLAHLTRQWQREAAKFTPELRVHVLRTGRASYRLGDLYDDGMPDVVVTNYHKLDGWAAALAGQVRSVVFDECQEVRISGTKKYDAAKAIADSADYVLGLSGTPVYNYGSEIHTIYEVVAPGVLGSKREFMDAWCSGRVEQTTASGSSKSTPVDDPVALGSHLREQGVMLLRTRADVGRELPPLQRIVQHCDADLSAIDRAEDRVAELAKLLVGGSLQTQQQRFAAEQEIDALMRQATGVAKAPYVCDFVRLLVDSGESKVVLFGHHHAFYDVVMAKLADLKPVKFTGNETLAQKDEARRRFIEDPECKLLVMAVRSGAGLDGLQTVCGTVVHGELDWSPRVIEQATGRVHRDQQANGCKEYVMVCDYGSDPTVSEKLGLKDQQSQGIMGRESAVFRTDDSAAAVRRLAEVVLERRRTRAA